ncbi:hypothetical protein PVL29_016349 [Vitis rotundifolia]|uniref:Uncharacterized protein n=1 Tax=Vitis rotundifolia TaxID=103349 RepID=A0AA38Z7S4_VITRO|nr:hypothetical protein PVL29_016349 [Vitis rotundifolia]
MKGNLHKKMHSLTMSFGNSSIIKDHLLLDIDRLIRFNMDSWTSRILLMEEAKKITFDLTVKQLMSFDPGEWTESLRKEYVLVIEGFFTVPFPLFSATYRRAIQARTKVAEALNLVVRERRKAKEEGEEEKKNDMLAALLDSGDNFSDEQIVDFILALLVAGYETTSTIMTLAIKFLTETPLALAQLRVSFFSFLTSLLLFDLFFFCRKLGGPRVTTPIMLPPLEPSSLSTFSTIHIPP